MEKMPYKILCISGSGRSGSTLLSMMLSQNTGVFNLGQCRDLWAAYELNRVCSCNEYLHDCQIWHTVIETIRKNNAHSSTTKINKNMRSFIKHVAALNCSEIVSQTNQLKEKYKEFLCALQSVIQTCSIELKTNIFVDSSKSPEIALAYSLLENTEVFTLNLVRDPRAVAVSWSKKHSYPAIRSLMHAWKKRQLQLKAWQHKGILKNYIALRYEDFTQNSIEYIKLIQNWTKSEDAQDYFISANEINIKWDEQHLFSPTNETILKEKKQRIKITPSNRWKKTNTLLRISALIWTFPECLYYIFKKNDQEYLDGNQ